MRNIVNKITPKIKLNTTILHYKGDDILKTILEDGSVQPFYRSTNKVWYPFAVMDNGIFVSKWLYGVPEGQYIPPELHIFGTQNLKDLSNQLGEMNLEATREVSTQKEVNEFIEMEGIAVDSSFYDTKVKLAEQLLS